MTRSQEELRAALHPKWRNQLKKAERAELDVSASTDAAAFEWLLDRHDEQQGERGFTGPRSDTLSAFRRATRTPGEECHVLVARKLEAPVAGLLLVRHGGTATYVVGWADERGRAANATNLLLWRAVERLKAVGCSWFDLGGIDEVATPGITRFKRRLGGTEYRLAGEWWAF